MSKVNIKRKTPLLDMNPMVDLAFLLVTFFMLTTTFKSEEPVEIFTPTSHAEIKLPEKNIMIITVSSDERIFFSIDGKFFRAKLLEYIGDRYKVNFTPSEIEKFTLISSHGMPVSMLKEYINMPNSERQSLEQPGIPIDSLNNELLEWVVLSRMTNPKIRVAIKGDEKVSYPLVKRIIDILVEKNITRFNLITESESEEFS